MASGWRTRSGIIGGLWVLAVVSASAAPPVIPPARPAAPPVEATPDGPPPVTAELANLPLREAAPKLAELTGLEIVLPEVEENPPPTGEAIPTAAPAPSPPRLDLDRRATLSWRNTPLAQALREFCRAYACRFDSSGDLGGTLYLNAGTLPSGPHATTGGYSVEVAHVHFRDERTADLAGQEATVDRGIDLQLQVRARSGDPTPIYGFHNVRIIDDQGRDALEHPGERDAFGLSGGVTPTAFPDERRRQVSFPWPYPVPRRLRTIEGDLILFSQLRRIPVDLRLPRAGDPPLARKFGPIQLETREASFEDGRYTLGLHLTAPGGLGVQIAGALPRATLVLADGTAVRASLSGGDSGDEDDGSGAHLTSYELAAPGLKQRPARLLLDLVLKSDPDRRLHFRLQDYPAILSTAPAHGTGFRPRIARRSFPPTPRRSAQDDTLRGLAGVPDGGPHG